MKKRWKPLFILIPIVVLGITFYVLSSQEAGVPENNRGEDLYLLSEGSFNEKGESSGGNKGNNTDIVENNQSRRTAMAYVAKNIAGLSPVEPVLGGTWFVIRFWFVDDTNFYAEYEDGHILRKLLIFTAGDQYTVKGYFEAGENDWDLIEGEDPFFGRPLDLYEYSEGTGEWVKRN